MSKFCTNCGSPVNEGTAFCTGCGAPLTAQAEPQAQSADGGQQYPQEQPYGQPMQQPYPQQPEPQFVEDAASGGDNPSAAYGGSSPYTGEPANVQPAADAAFVPPVPQQYQNNMNAGYGAPNGQFAPNGNAYNPSAAYGGSSPYTGEPAQQPYGQPAAQPEPQAQFVNGAQQYPQGQDYPQQPYGQQPYGQPQYQQPYGAPYGQPYGYPQPPKKSKKGLWIAIIAIVLVLGLAAVALFVWPGFLNKKGLEGKWINDRTGFALELKDGKATVHADDAEDSVFDYTLDGDMLKFDTEDGGKLSYIFKIAGDALTLYYEDGGLQIPEAYTRDGAETPDGREIVGRWSSGDIDEFIIDEDTITQIGTDSDGDYELNYTYTRDGDKLTIKLSEEDASSGDTPEDEVERVRVYDVKDGVLTFSDEDGNVTASFDQKGGSEFVKASYGGMDGVWLNDSDDEIIINGDTLVGVDGTAYSLKIEGDTFTIYAQNSGYSEEYNFVYWGKELELYAPDGGKLLVTLRRKIGAGKPVVTAADLIGKWISVKDPDEYYRFNADGTGDYYGEEFTFTMTGTGSFDMTTDAGTHGFTYKIDGDTLTLHDVYFDEDFTYYRSGTTPPRPSYDTAILGDWDGELGDVMTINPDGTIKVVSDGESYDITYELDGENITVHGGGNTRYYTYTLEGDVLTFWEETNGVKEKIEEYVRKGSGSAAVTLADLVGSWQTDDGYSMLITSDSKYTASDGTEYVLELNGDVMRLYIPQSEEDYSMKFKLEGDTLTFMDDNGAPTTVYHRQKQ